MLKYILINLTLIIALAASQAHAEITTSNMDALQIIAARKGLNRLDFDVNSKKWSYFQSGLITTVKRYIYSKNRHSIMAPLEDLVKELDETYVKSVEKNPEIFHVLRRAYASLTSLYSFYKIHPDTDAGRQLDFISRFSTVLAKFKDMLTDIEGRVAHKNLYKPMPWFGEEGMDFSENEKALGLKYLDMGERGLSELNKALRKIGNDDTQVNRAMEFYPTRERTTAFQSSFNQSLTKKPVIFIMHGTFAANSPEYKSDENILFQQTKYLAQSIANDQNVPVEVYSFGWNGVNTNEARIDAGVEFANFVSTYFPEDEYCDIYIGHSHGGNVLFHFAKTVRYDRVPFMMVTLATPIRKDFITDNVNYLFQFYTEGDLIQYIGSYEITRRNSTGTGEHVQAYRKVLRDDIDKLGYFAHNGRYNDVKIYATKVLHNGQTPKGGIKSHSDLKYLIAALPRVLDKLIRYDANSEFVLNVELNETKPMNITEMDRLQFQLSKFK